MSRLSRLSELTISREELSEFIGKKCIEELEDT